MRRSLLSLVVSLAIPGLASAEGGDVGAAEMYFQQGRELLDQGKLAEACPRFAESFRLDPATGTLLGLAMCHEQEGKLATAWSEYIEVQGRAQKEGDAERRTFAQQKSQQLEPRLSSLTVEVPADVGSVRGFELHRNGVLVGQGVWGIPTPLDGGTHVVEAMAPGKRTWTQSVTLASEGARAKVAVPALQDEPAIAATTRALAPMAAEAEPGTDQGTSTPGPFEEMNTWRWVGVGAAGAGLVSLGIGGYFVGTALDQHSRGTDLCQGGSCTQEGLDLRADAVSDGNLATVFMITGGVLVGTGAVLFFTMAEPAQESAASALWLSATAAPTTVNATLNGRF